MVAPARSRSLLAAFVLALLFHAPLLALAPGIFGSPESLDPSSKIKNDGAAARRPMRVRRWIGPTPVLTEEPALAEETPSPEPDVDPAGQIVEIAPPADARRPDEARFLAEFDSRTEEESVDPRFRVDRAVVADRYSPEDVAEAVDGEEAPAEVGPGGAEGDRRLGGSLSLFPERAGRWDFERAPIVGGGGGGSPLAREASGSPSNDWLEDVKRGDRTALNAHEFLYASFWNRVKRLVSFYADQCLSNARPTVPLRNLRYDMELAGMIGLDGSLHSVEVTSSSGVPEFDRAIEEAFRLAAPFPDPPRGAASPDGFIHMRRFGFTILLGGAQAELDAIDPRQGVRFPGLETVPR